jgi:hypothetical protein
VVQLIDESSKLSRDGRKRTSRLKFFFDRFKIIIIISTTMAPPAPLDMRVPPAAARWMVHVLGNRAPDPNTLQELLQCDSGLNNLICEYFKKTRERERGGQQ